LPEVLVTLLLLYTVTISRHAMFKCKMYLCYGWWPNWAKIKTLHLYNTNS